MKTDYTSSIHRTTPVAGRGRQEIGGVCGWQNGGGFIAILYMSERERETVCVFYKLGQ